MSSQCSRHGLAAGWGGWGVVSVRAWVPSRNGEGWGWGRFPPPAAWHRVRVPSHPSRRKGRALRNTCHGELPWAREAMEKYGFFTKKERERERGRRCTTLPATTSQPPLGLLASSPSLRALQNGTAAGHGDPVRAGAQSSDSTPQPGTLGNPCSEREWCGWSEPGCAFPYSCQPRCGGEGSRSRKVPCEVTSPAARAGTASLGMHPGASPSAFRGCLPGGGGGLGLEGGGLRPLPSSLRPSRDPGAGCPGQVNSGLERRCHVDALPGGGKGQVTTTTARVGRRFVSLSASAAAAAVPCWLWGEYLGENPAITGRLGRQPSGGEKNTR